MSNEGVLRQDVILKDIPSEGKKKKEDRNKNITIRGDIY